MKNIKFKEVFKGTKGQVYSVLYNNAEYSELTKFFIENENNFENEVGFILDTLHKIAHEFGPRDHFFKHQDGDNIHRLIIKQPKKTKLRLYCLLCGSKIVIIGGCAVKKTRTWQEDPLIENIIRDLRAIDRFFISNDTDFNNISLLDLEISI